MVNLGVIEINPWSSTIKKEDYPSWCMIDIDPTDANITAYLCIITLKYNYLKLCHLSTTNRVSRAI